MTMKQLKEELVNLGMPADDVVKFNSKVQVIAAINAIKAAKVVNKVDSLEEKIDIKEEKQVAKVYTTKAKRQYAYWDSEPKVSILVPLEGKEKQGVVREEYSQIEGRIIQTHVSGAIQPVTENGATFLVPKGVYVEVPRPVAKLIQDKYNQTAAAGSNILIDRIDPETGKKVADQL